MDSRSLDAYVRRSSAVLETSPPSTQADTRAVLVEPLLTTLGWDVRSDGCETDVTVRGVELEYLFSVSEPQTPALFVAVEPADSNLRSGRLERLGRAMSLTGVDRALYTNGRRIIALDGSQESQSFTTDLGSVTEHANALAGFSIGALESHLARHGRDVAARRIAVRRDSIANTIATELAAVAGASYEREFETSATEFLTQLIRSLSTGATATPTRSTPSVDGVEDAETSSEAPLRNGESTDDERPVGDHSGAQPVDWARDTTSDERSQPADSAASTPTDRRSGSPTPAPDAGKALNSESGPAADPPSTSASESQRTPPEPTGTTDVQAGSTNARAGSTDERAEQATSVADSATQTPAVDEREGRSTGSTGAATTSDNDAVDTEAAQSTAPAADEPDELPPDDDPAGEYVVRFFNQRSSIGAVGTSTSSSALAQAAEYMFEQGLRGVRLPWGPEDGETVLNDEPVLADGTPMAAYKQLSNRAYVNTGGSVVDRAKRVEALATRANLRVMLSGDWPTLDA